MKTIPTPIKVGIGLIFVVWLGAFIWWSFIDITTGQVSGKPSKTAECFGEIVRNAHGQMTGESSGDYGCRSFERTR